MLILSVLIGKARSGNEAAWNDGSETQTLKRRECVKQGNQAGKYTTASQYSGRKRMEGSKGKGNGKAGDRLLFINITVDLPSVRFSSSARRQCETRRKRDQVPG